MANEQPRYWPIGSCGLLLRLPAETLLMLFSETSNERTQVDIACCASS